MPNFSFDSRQAESASKSLFWSMFFHRSEMGLLLHPFDHSDCGSGTLPPEKWRRWTGRSKCHLRHWNHLRRKNKTFLGNSVPRPIRLHRPSNSLKGAPFSVEIVLQKLRLHPKPVLLQGIFRFMQFIAFSMTPCASIRIKVKSSFNAATQFSWGWTNLYGPLQTVIRERKRWPFFDNFIVKFSLLLFAMVTLSPNFCFQSINFLQFLNSIDFVRY